MTRRRRWPRPSAPSGPLLAGACARVVALLLLALSPWACSERPHSGAPTRAPGASGDSRPFEGRTADDVVHRPWNAAAGAAASLSRRAELTRRRAALQHTIDQQWDDVPREPLLRIALVDGELGDPAPALTLLAEATSRPRAAAALVDLSAVALTTPRGATAPAIDAVVAAFDAALLAARLEPGNAAAAFNAALAAEHLLPVGRARAFWDAAERVETDPAWLQEITQRRGRLASRDVADAASPAPVSASTALDLIRTEPQAVREWFEEVLLAQWADARLSGRRDEADRHAVDVTRVGRALSSASRDVTAAEIADRVNLAAQRGDDRDLAVGHLAYAKARVAYERGDRVAAATHLAEAGVACRRAESPCAAWVTLEQTVIAYLARDRTQARRLLASLGPEGAWEGRLAIRARRHWLYALVAMLGRDPEAALDAYRRASDIYSRMGEREHVWHLENATADALRTLGEPTRAWQHLGVALRGVDQVRQQRRTHLFMLNASLLSALDLRFEASGWFQTASVEAARARGVASALVEGLARRSIVNLLRDDTTAAAGDIAEAERLLPTLQDARERRYMAGHLDLARGMLATLDLRQRLAALERAADVFSTFEPAEVAPLMALVGQQRELAGDPAAALAAYRAGLAREADASATQSSDPFKASLLARGWPLQARASRLLLDRGGDPWDALPLVLATRALDAEVLGAPTHRGRLPRRPVRAGTLTLVLEVLPDRLVLWWWTHDRAGVEHHRVPAATVRAVLTAWRSALARGESAHGAGQRLSQWVLEPVAATLPGVTAIDISLPRELAGLPVAALPVPHTQTLVVDTLAVRHLAAGVPASPSTRRGANGLTVVVGEPRAASGLARLPAAAQEARHIARIHAERSVLLQHDEARRDLVVRNLSRATVFHFAGHARPNAQRPERSALVLAGWSPSAPTGHELTAEDIAAMRLDQLEVAVLAACSTDRGRDYDGGMVLSLGRSFLRAGARHVVASLWDVADAQSSILTAHLHEALAQGLDAPTALLRAQRRMRARGQMEWAAFVIVSRPSQPARRNAHTIP